MPPQGRAWGACGCLRWWGSVGSGLLKLGSTSVCNATASFQPPGVRREEINEATRGLRLSPDAYYVTVYLQRAREQILRCPGLFRIWF